uniref:Uncharacterized protein n=1 Tax=Romanomermis culicivorax TaxID=13658 RepID=A0A915HKW1_ROMCU
MGGVNSVNDAKLLRTQASDPSQYQCGHVVRDGRLLFSVQGTIMFAKILVQSWRGVRCVNVNGHGDVNAKTAKEIDQDHFVKRAWREKFNGWINMWRVARRQ